MQDALYDWLDNKFIHYSTDSRWGFFGILVSTTMFLFPLALAFWSISISLEGGRIMTPSSFMSWLFAILAVAGLVLWLAFAAFTVLVYRHWRRNPLDNNTPQRLTDIENAINTSSASITAEIRNLATEIGEDRRERNKPIQ